MTDDIVTRLRNNCDSNNCWCPMGAERCLDMEAADEIERLREEVASWRKQAIFEHAGHCWCIGSVESHVEKSKEGRDW